MRKRKAGLKKATKKNQCQAKTWICSGELVATYYNSDGKALRICGPCTVYLRRGGAKFSQNKPKKKKVA